MINSIDDAVYLVERNSDGALEIQGSHLLSDLSNTVPNVGDRITLSIQGVGATSIMQVQSRHFVRHLDEESKAEWSAWFLIVEAIDRHEDDELIELVSREFVDYVRPEPPTNVKLVKQKKGRKKSGTALSPD